MFTLNYSSSAGLLPLLTLEVRSQEDADQCFLSLVEALQCLVLYIVSTLMRLQITLLCTGADVSRKQPHNKSLQEKTPEQAR